MKKKIKKISQKLSGKLNIKSGIFFMFIGGLMVISISFLAFPEVFAKEDVEKILPKENLVALVEIGDLKVPNFILNKYPDSEQLLNQSLSHIFGFDFAKTKTWRGASSGIAFYETENQINWILLLEVMDKQLVQNFILELSPEIQTIQEEKLTIIIPEDRNFKCTMYKGYLACTGKNSNLLSSFHEEQKTIGQSADYQRWAAQMPSKAYLKSFFYPEKLNKILPDVSSVFTNNLDTGGLIIKENENNLELSMFFVKKNSQEEVLEKNNSENLVSALPQNTILFLNGKNTENTINSALNEFALKDSEYPEFILARMRAILRNQFFGNYVSLEDDILPLFESSFIFALHQAENNLSPILILDTNDEIFAEAKRQKFIKAFEKTIANSIAEIVSNENENNEALEVFPNHNNIERIDEEIKGSVLTAIKNNEQEIVLARKDKILLISNNTTILKTILNNMALPKFQREPAKIVSDFPFKTFSSFDEIFAIQKEAFAYLPFSIFTEYLSIVKSVSGKIVRIPDSFRIDFQICF